MQQVVFEVATFCGLGAAALAAMVMIGNGVGLATLLLRTMLIGGSVFFFAVLGGQVVGRVLLESYARKELEKVRTKQAAMEDKSEKETQDLIAVMKRRQGAASVKKNPTSEDTVRSKAA